MFPFTDNYFQDENNGGSPPANQSFPPFYHDDYHDLLHAMRLLPPPAIDASPSIPSPSPPSQEPPPNDAPAAGEGRKRATRKDRHSKIVTANGPRDRRMRLSLDVAKRFFELQDALHFDKPSKTVDWLLNKSKHAIKSLASCSASGKTTDHAYYSSECEVDSKTVIGNDGNFDGDVIKITSTAEAAAKNPRAREPPRKTSSSPTLSKESRLKARARARERTIEKRLKQLGPPPACYGRASVDSREADSCELAQVVARRQPQMMMPPATSGRGEISTLDYFNDQCSANTPSGAWGTFDGNHCSF